MNKLQLYFLLFLAMLGMGMGFPHLVGAESANEKIFSCQRHQVSDKSPAGQPASQSLPDSCRPSGKSSGSTGEHLSGPEAAFLSLLKKLKLLSHV